MNKIEKTSTALAKSGKPAIMTAKKIKAAIAASARIAAAPHPMNHVLLSISTRKIRRQKMKLAQGNDQIGPAWQKRQAARFKKPESIKLLPIANTSGGQKRQRALDKLNRMTGGNA